jgi:peptidoglycan/LPS O-acetylase OafA/YrhL
MSHGYPCCKHHCQLRSYPTNTNPEKAAQGGGIPDYSYGLFLYGFVIQQVIAQMGPWAHHWYINLILSLPIAAAFAAFSWHAIEKPALQLRQLLPAIEGLVESLVNRLVFWRKKA